MTLFDTIAHHASQTPHQPALLGSQGELDYQSLWQQIQQLAGVLQGPASAAWPCNSTTACPGH